MTRVISWFDNKKWTQFPEFVFEVKEDFRENFNYETIYPPYKNGEIEDFKQKYYYPLVKKYGSKHIILEEKEYQDYYEPMYSVIIKNMYYRYTCKVKYENAITKEYFNWINEIDSKITNLEWINEINKVDITIEEDDEMTFVRINDVPIKYDKFVLSCTTLPIDYIQENIYNCNELQTFIINTTIKEMKKYPDNSGHSLIKMFPYMQFINEVKKDGVMFGFTRPYWYDHTCHKINQNMAKLIGLNITRMIRKYNGNIYHYHKVQIFKLTHIVKHFLEDLLKTYVRKDMNLYKIFIECPSLDINWNHKYVNVITRYEILELLKLFDDEKPKEKIKVEEKIDIYDQILEDNKKLAQNCKKLMDKNKKLKQIIQLLQRKITNDSSV